MTQNNSASTTCCDPIELRWEQSIQHIKNNTSSAWCQAEEATTKDVEANCPLCRRSKAAEERRARFRCALQVHPRCMHVMVCINAYIQMDPVNWGAMRTSAVCHFYCRGVVDETVRGLILTPSAGEEVKALIPVAQWQRVTSLLVSMVDAVELPSLRNSACEACQVWFPSKPVFLCELMKVYMHGHAVCVQ